jgi:hypothetical protein
MTVPYGGDFANPMVQQERGPSAAGYIIGSILIIAGIVGGIAWGVVNGVGFFDAIDDFERAPVGGVQTMDLEAGDMVVYGEKSGGDGTSAQLGRTAIRPAGGEGDELTLEQYDAEITYDNGTRVGRAEFTVEIPDDGEYEILSEPITGGATTVAVGPSVAGKLVSAIVGALVIGGLGVIIGVILLIVTGVRRRKFRQRRWLDGYQGGGQQPGTWNPQAGGYGAPPAAPGGWNPPPPPGGTGYPPPPGNTF